MQEQQKPICLLDLIDKRVLEHLLTGFCEKFNSGMKIVCFNSKSEPIMIGENTNQKRLWSSICSFYKSILNNSNFCDEHDLQKAIELKNSKNPVSHYYVCEPLKMVDIIAPIVIKNKVIGVVITGQRLDKAEFDNTLEKVCGKYHEHKCEFQEVFEEEKNKEKQSKICSLNDIEKLREELQSFADLIGELCSTVEEYKSNVNELEKDKHIRETFWEILAHNLSIPLLGALIDVSNLKDEIDTENLQHLFNEILELQLVVKNVLHDKTNQAENNRFPIYITEQLKSVYEMFYAQAKDKGCDLNISIILKDNIHISLLLDDLKNIDSTYKRIILHKFPYFPKKNWEKWDFRVEENSVYKKVTISKLVEYIHNIDKAKAKELSVLDAATNEPIKFDFLKLADCYLFPIKIDPNDLNMAYKNLIHNAIKYSYSNNQRYISIRCFCLKEEVKIEVENYGVGITKEEIDQDKIWESGYRGVLSKDRCRPGGGLGLSHVKKVIEKIHNGKVTCKSEPKLGGAYLTTFAIIFNK